MRTDGPLERLLEAGKPPAERPLLLIVAAHPDDETIGAGACIARFADTCTVVHVTDGAPSDRRFFPATAGTLTRTAYARVRREEATRALAAAGVDASRVVCLSLRDQEAAFDMDGLTRRLAALVLELRPEILVTHAYEGGHPDHDATSFAVHAASMLAGSRRDGWPSIVEMTSYHDQGGATVRGEFLPYPGARELTIELTEEDRQRKRAMFAAYATQREMLAPFHLETERFRLAPRYRFSAPPHEGRLHYERFGFAISGPMWRALRRSAAKKLDLGEGPP
jgi:LmbE family N-acetylglucosaminyl deacetylase